ncbi:Transcription repressor OFP7 [Camellia lanceoleosa]|uniref:Transcription repressor OFP7 n=1 Tax=Camellia lanceoleosa TaxID=1840588 RepID=A0ACC0IB83_9ERIC|nr:Transcription repressor OFP7 [Camellia lanceoleosa]
MLPSFLAEGKAKDSFAVVMELVDPYEDFKASMMEMILAKQLFEETGKTATGTTLIPTRFVWPYGGGSVFLCDSFIG